MSLVSGSATCYLVVIKWSRQSIILLIDHIETFVNIYPQSVWPFDITGVEGSSKQNVCWCTRCRIFACFGFVVASQLWVGRLVCSSFQHCVAWLDIVTCNNICYNVLLARALLDVWMVSSKACVKCDWYDLPWSILFCFILRPAETLACQMSFVLLTSKVSVSEPILAAYTFVCYSWMCGS